MRNVIDDFTIGYCGQQTVSVLRPRAVSEPSLQATLAGRLFRKSSLRPLDSLYVDSDGVMCARLADGREVALFITPNELLLIDPNGSVVSLNELKADHELGEMPTEQDIMSSKATAALG